MLFCLERNQENQYSYAERFRVQRYPVFSTVPAGRSIYRKEHTVSLVEQGLVLMVVGMAVVVAFLIILVFSTKSLSAIINKYFPEKEIPVKKRPQSTGRSADAEIAAAVAAATAYSQASTH